MQKIATRIFIVASLLFGALGIAVVLTLPENDNVHSSINSLLLRLMFITVFIILPSFALSIASKYLAPKP